MRQKPYIRYFGTGPLPMYLAFTMDPVAYANELKRMGVPPNDFVSEGASGTTHIITKAGQMPTCIVCIRDQKGISREQLHGLIVHEAVHCWQQARRFMNEYEPSIEFEAYTVQCFAQWFMEEAGRIKKPRCKK